MFIDNREQAKDRLDDLTLEFLEKATKTVQSSAVSLVAVDSGHLKQSIDTMVDDAEFIGYVGTNTFYGIYLEFGTGEFAKNGGGRKGGWVYPDPEGKRDENGRLKFYFTYGQRPQPYLLPAFRTNKSNIEALLKSTFSQF